MYSIPQEIELWYLVPAIRRELARQLVAKGLKKKEVAQLLGVTNAAVSQYLHMKRGTLELPNQLQQEIAVASERIAKQPSAAFTELMRLIALSKETRFMCELCKRYNKDVIRYCHMEPEAYL
jgi:hypothetical protein